MRKIKKQLEDLTLQNLSSTVPNKMHFEVQLNTRAQVFKPKKGKGSYTRKGRKERDDL